MTHKTTETARRTRRTLRRTTAATAALAAGALTLTALAVGSPGQASTGSAMSLRVVGLTDGGKLVKFKAGAPEDARALGTVRGLVGDMRLVGIDYRVQDGALYGVGDAGGIYTIDTRWRYPRATKVSQLTVPLQGTSFGVDFNPAANRLRVVSDTGQNLRHNIDDPVGVPAAGTTTTDGTLSYMPPSPPGPAATGVTAAAYTNNDLDATTATTLFDIDTMLDQVAVQSPANSGALAPTGRLGVDAGPRAGFDIYTVVSGGAAAGNFGLAALDVGGRTGLYTVDPLTGRAWQVGSFRSRTQVVDVAVPLNQGN